MSQVARLDERQPMPRGPGPLHAAARGRQLERGTKILFALGEREEPAEALRHVLQLCELLEAELHVVRVVPEFAQLPTSATSTTAWGVTPIYVVPDEDRAVGETLDCMRATSAWLASISRADATAIQLQVLSGSFVEQTAAYAHSLGVELIAVPARPGRFGTTVTRLAQAAGVPVLVARAPRAAGSIVAATDLTDQRYPVLRKASELGALLDASVVAVHNVAPVAQVAGVGGALWAVPEELGASVLELQRSRLEQASTRAPGDVEPVLATERSPAEAILHEASARDAELVLVGTRARTWLSRLMSGSVAARVVNEATQSVMVTPLEPTESSTSRSVH